MKLIISLFVLSLIGNFPAEPSALKNIGPLLSHYTSTACLVWALILVRERQLLKGGLKA